MGRTTRERGVEVRRRIEQAAVELIAERGAGAVSTRLLAERAGVTPGLVHYHYRSIDDALRTAMVSAITAMVDEMGHAVGDAPTPEEAMGVLWSLLEPQAADGPTSVLLIEAVLAAMRDPQLRAEMAAAVGRCRVQLADRLRETGVTQPEQTAAVLVATIDGVMLHRILFDDLSADVVGPVVDRLLIRSHDGGSGQ